LDVHQRDVGTDPHVRTVDAETATTAVAQKTYDEQTLGLHGWAFVSGTCLVWEISVVIHQPGKEKSLLSSYYFTKGHSSSPKPSIPPLDTTDKFGSLSIFDISFTTSKIYVCFSRVYVCFANNSCHGAPFTSRLLWPEFGPTVSTHTDAPHRIDAAVGCDQVPTVTQADPDCFVFSVPLFVFRLRPTWAIGPPMLGVRPRPTLADSSASARLHRWCLGAI